MHADNDYILHIRDGTNMVPLRWSQVARLFAHGVLVFDKHSGCYAVKGT